MCNYPLLSSDFQTVNNAISSDIFNKMTAVQLLEESVGTFS